MINGLTPLNPPIKIQPLSVSAIAYIRDERKKTINTEEEATGKQMSARISRRDQNKLKSAKK